MLINLEKLMTLSSVTFLSFCIGTSKTANVLKIIFSHWVRLIYFSSLLYKFCACSYLFRILQQTAWRKVTASDLNLYASCIVMAEVESWLVRSDDPSHLFFDSSG